MNKSQLLIESIILIGIITLLIIPNSLAAKSKFSIQISSLEDLLINSYKKDVNYLMPTSAQMKQAQNLFEKIFLKGSFDNDDVFSWQNLGFKIEKIKDHNIDYIVIRERSDINPGGRGFYLIKVGSNSSNILEAPHRPTDEQTHKIIFKLLTEGNYKASSWNSIIRRNTDLAKEPNSYFNAFTIAVAKSFTEPKIFQLHGFDGAAHEINGDMILSNTTRNPNLARTNIANCLKDNKDFKSYKILEFPNDIKELGGTKNINAELFYEHNPKGLFFHIETSIRLRLALRDQKNLRDQFSGCFIEDSDKKSLQELR